MAKKNHKQRHPDYRAITYPGYFGFPDALTVEEDFYSLSGSALKMLVEIGRQYKGHNNGDLCATYSMLKDRGWNSKSLIDKALKELLAKNWILLTRQGGMGIGPSLYAITWQPINHCGGKLDVAPTMHAPRSLKPTPQKIATPNIGASIP